jgi:uncharacterized membrane protein
MKSLKTTARLTGLGYLIIFFSGFFANFYTLESMVVDGHALLTAVNIIDQLSQFQMGMVAFSIMVLVDIILAFPLYKLLNTESERMATISSILRFINGVLFSIALFSLINIVSLAKNSPQDLAGHVEGLLNQFNMIWNIGLLFFGAHLLLLGWLILKSVNFPRMIGLLLQIAGFAYLADSGAQLFFSNYDAYKGIFEVLVISGGVIGEFSLTLFLLIKGIRLPKTSSLQFAN